MRQFLRTSALENQPTDTNFVFLGGTINGSTWRDKLIPLLKVGYFNPIVANWTEEDVHRESQAKIAAHTVLYVVTPKQHGHYVIAELTAQVLSDAPSRKVVVTFLDEDDGAEFTDHQKASNNAIKNLLSGLSSTVELFTSLEETAEFLNKHVAENI